MDLPGTKVPVAACLRRMRLMVVRVRPTRPAIALCCMPSRASASTSCLVPIDLDRALLQQSLRVEKICNNWFELVTVQRQIWGNDHLKLRFWTSTIPLGIEGNVRPRKGRVSLGSSHGYMSCQFQPLRRAKFRSISILLPQMGVQQLFYKSVLYAVEIRE